MASPAFSWPWDAAAALPSTGDIQRAYAAAKKVNPARHRDSLEVTHASCEPLDQRKAYCQIDFIDTAGTNDRLFFTVVTLERSGDAWVLLSGLCFGL